MYRANFFEVQRFYRRNKINILMYHRFSEKPEPFKLNGADFEKQLNFLRKKFNPIHLSTYATALVGKTDLPPNSVILTIDDGYLDNYEIAYPLLKKYGVPATIFLATHFVDQHEWLWPLKLLYILQNTAKKQFNLVLDGRNRRFDVETFQAWHGTQLAIFNYLRIMEHKEKNQFLIDLASELAVDVPEKTCGDFLPMTWAQIREMHRNGVEFGSHTCTHPILSRQDGAAIHYETAASKKLIENRLQAPVDSFCYPNGQPEDYNGQVIDAVKKAGYRCAVTTVSGSNNATNSRPYELMRKGLGRTSEYEIYRDLLKT